MLEILLCLVGMYIFCVVLLYRVESLDRENLKMLDVMSGLNDTMYNINKTIDRIQKELDESKNV